MTLPRSKKPPPGGEFSPPFCPNPKCRHHTVTRDWSFRLHAAYVRLSDGERIQRYICTACDRTFSAQTFRTTYWLQRRDLFEQIAALSVAGAGLRQIARHLDITHGTVARHIARAARHCLLFHRQRTGELPIAETIVFDGFETFEFSQYFPCHFNLAVGSRSWFIYHFTDSPLRRKGRMTPAQRARRTELEKRHGRPDPKAIEKDTAELIGDLLPNVPAGAALELRSDEHPAYPRALRRLRREVLEAPLFHHARVNSKKPRTARNPLFPVNLSDLLLRHCNANHRRETIAFSKRRQGGLERLAVLTVWRNYIKKQRELGDEETPATIVGAETRKLSWTEVLAHRLFPRRIALPRRWVRYYRRKVKTTALGPPQTEHCLSYAF